MRIIGLSGGICSGKTAVSKILRHHEIPVWEWDEVVQKMYEPTESFKGPQEMEWKRDVQNGMVQYGVWGAQEDGSWNRSEVRAWWMMQKKNNSPVLQEWYKTVNQKIEEDKNRWVKSQQVHDTIVLDVPLLIEVGWVNQVDEVWIVDVSPETQKKRWMERNPYWSQEDRNEVLKGVKSRRERLWYAHRCIENNGSLKELEENVENLVKTIRSYK